MVELSCPGCGHHLRIASKFAGSIGKCKYCGESISVPIESFETPSDLDSSVPGSGRQDGSQNPASGESHAGGILFDKIMDNQKPAVGGVTGLDAPLASADPMGLGTPLPPSQPVAPLTDDALGCLFWGTAFFLPPVGLVWALAIPPDNEQRGKGLLGSTIMLLIAIVTFAGSYLLVSQSAGGFSELMSAMNSSNDFVNADEEEESFFESVLSTVAQAPASTVLLHGVDVPLLKGLVLQPSSPMKLQDGGLQNVPSEQLSFYSGSVQYEYRDLGSDYQRAMMSADWDYQVIGGYEQSIGFYNDLYGTANGKAFYLRILETNLGALVTFVTRTN